MVWWCSECWGVPEDYIEGEEVGFVPEVLEERQTEEDEDEEEPTDLFAEILASTEHEDEDEDEESEEEQEEDPHEQCDRCGNPATAGLINDQFICVECREDEE
jgi:hypothetical protein